MKTLLFIQYYDLKVILVCVQLKTGAYANGLLLAMSMYLGGAILFRKSNVMQFMNKYSIHIDPIVDINTR